MSTKENAKYLERLGYQINHTSIGWWVDGVCGYKVTQYVDTKTAAVAEAIKNIRDAKKAGETPIWLF